MSIENSSIPSKTAIIITLIIKREIDYIYALTNTNMLYQAPILRWVLIKDLFTEVLERSDSIEIDVNPFNNGVSLTKDIVVLPLNINENNTWLPTDFRTKEEIEVTIEENKQWERAQGEEAISALQHN